MPDWLGYPLILLGVGFIMAVGWLLARALVAVISTSPAQHLGVRDGRLAPCADSPHCVSSQADDQAHSVAPIAYQSSSEAAQRRLLEIVRSMPRARVVTERPDYIHAEIRKAGLGLVDDLELYLDEDARLIHVRGASRLPYYDFRSNRRRVERIRAAFRQDRAAFR